MNVTSVPELTHKTLHHCSLYIKRIGFVHSILSMMLPHMFGKFILLVVLVLCFIGSRDWLWIVRGDSIVAEHVNVPKPFASGNRSKATK